MSDNPNKLKAKLLSECSTEEQREFAKMLAEMCAQADAERAGHRCRVFVPSKVELERIAKFVEPPNYDKCLKCGKGRLYLTEKHWNISRELFLVCSEEKCGFSIDITDVDTWW